MNRRLLEQAIKREELHLEQMRHKGEHELRTMLSSVQGGAGGVAEYILECEERIRRMRGMLE